MARIIAQAVSSHERPRGEGAREGRPRRGAIIATPLEQIGKYRIVAEIGRGGTSHVYKAYDPTLDRHVAIKVIAAEASGDRIRRRRFEREAQAAALLNHRHIVKVYDFGSEDERLYIAMELLEGMDLKRALAEGRLERLGEKLEVAREIADGLAFAHVHGVVHRDLKPANIHLGPGGPAKIMDFGLARLRGSDITRSGMVMGTPHYMSPEQVRGEHVDARSDVFSLGSILYEMLAGRKPFDADSVHSVMYQVMKAEPRPLATLCPDLPPAASALVGKAMARSATERFVDGAEIREALAGILRSIGEGQPAESPDSISIRVSAPASDRRLTPPPGTSHPRLTRGLVAFLVATALLASVAVARRWERRFVPARPSGGSSSHAEIDALTRTLVEGQVELARKTLAGGDPAEAARHARRALQFDAGNPSATETLHAALQAIDRLVGTALTEARTALDRGDTAAAAAAFWRLLQADADSAAAEALLPALDRAFESQARAARSLMEEARQAAERARGGRAMDREEADALAREGESAFSRGWHAVAARDFMQARERFRRALP
jgi:serine/threonine protein kinase